MSAYYTHNGQYVTSTGYGPDGMEPSPAPGETLVLEALNCGMPPEVWSRYSILTNSWEDPRTAAEIEAHADMIAKGKRSRLLAESDWTQLPDVPLATKEAWATYRQALRDITEQPGYPLDVVWPDAPG